MVCCHITFQHVSYSCSVLSCLVLYIPFEQGGQLLMLMMFVETSNSKQVPSTTARII